MKNHKNIIFFVIFVTSFLGFFIQPKELLAQEINLEDIKNPIDRIIFPKSSFSSSETIEGFIYLSNKQYFPLYKGF